MGTAADPSPRSGRPTPMPPMTALSRRMAEIIERPTASGWRLAIDESRGVLGVLDPTGTCAGTLDLSSATGSRFGSIAMEISRRLGQGARRGPDPIPIERPDAPSGMIDAGHGRFAGRRSMTARVEIDGRVYRMRHVSLYRSRISRDDTALARMRARFFGRPVRRITVGALDPTDKLVLCLFERAVTPGRRGLLTASWS